MRAVLMAFFDVCAYSDVMLTDRTLIRKVQVSQYYTSQFQYANIAFLAQLYSQACCMAQVHMTVL